MLISRCESKGLALKRLIVPHKAQRSAKMAPHQLVKFLLSQICSLDEAERHPGSVRQLKSPGLASGLRKKRKQLAPESLKEIAHVTSQRLGTQNRRLDQGRQQRGRHRPDQGGPHRERPAGPAQALDCGQSAQVAAQCGRSNQRHDRRVVSAPAAPFALNLRNQIECLHVSGLHHQVVPGRGVTDRQQREAAFFAGVAGLPQALELRLCQAVNQGIKLSALAG